MQKVFNFMVAHRENATNSFDNFNPVVLVYDSPLSSAICFGCKVCKFCMALENNTLVLIWGWNLQLLCKHNAFENIVLSYFGELVNIII